MDWSKLKADLEAAEAVGSAADRLSLMEEVCIKHGLAALLRLALAGHALAEGVKGEIQARERHGSGSIEHSSARLRTARALAEWRVVTGEVQ